jgi:hypothetical protein
MADNIKRASYAYVTISDKPGEGARVLDAVRKAGVNLLAVHAFPAGGSAQLDLVATDPAGLGKAVQTAGLKLSAAKTVFMIDGQDRPGACADTLAKLASAGINVTALTAVVAGGGRYGGLLWVKEPDVEKAAKALGAK